MFTCNTIEVDNSELINHHNHGDTNQVNEHKHIPNYHNIIQNNSNLRNNKYHNFEISRRYHIDSRPTYGAYIHNTLPRGPYLQYKFNDYKEIHNEKIQTDKLLSLSIPKLSSQSSSTMTINDNNSRSNDHCRPKSNNGHIDFLKNTAPCLTTKTQTLGRYKNNNYTSSNGDNYYFAASNYPNGIYTSRSGHISRPITSSLSRNELHDETQNRADPRQADKLQTFPNRNDELKWSNRLLNETSNRIDIPLIPQNGGYENEQKMHMNTKTSTVTSDNRITATDLVKSASYNGNISHSNYDLNKKTISNHKKYVTLHDVLNVKTAGLNQTQGWALLCQSIQALQDLFLSDSNLFTRILPLINSRNLQITSRGRIALNLIAEERGKLHKSSSILLQHHINDTPFKDIMEYLSPEYLNNIDQNKTFSISDIEKMWIYSLGVTLQKSLQNSFDKVNADVNTNRMNINEKRFTSSLDFVISSMREKNINQRASLMYLLDIIAEYCKTNNQHRPFSHIIIELFNDTIAKNEISTFPYPIDSHQTQYAKQRNDQPITMQRNSDLKVVRIGANGKAQHSSQPVLAEPNTNVENMPNLHVVRRRNNNTKKIRDSRRRTIHGTNIDLQIANELQLENHKANHYMNPFRSNMLNCASEPNLENMKSLTLPNLKIRRYNSSNKLIRNHMLGPQFILNSAIPVKTVNLIDEKSMHRRLVNVLLLNGQEINIYCHGTSTTAYQIFNAIVQLESVVDNFFLDLCILIGGDFVFLPKELKISKIAPSLWLQSANKLNPDDADVPLNLFLRIKFFLPKFRGSELLNSCNFLYIQLRKSILERQILCTEDDLIVLGGLALQAEVGNFQDNMKNVEYFTISHYLPEEVYRKNKEMARYIRNSHMCKKGMRRSEARNNFIRFVQELKEYGLHLYTAKWIKEKQTLDVYLAISLNGIYIFERTINGLSIDPNTNSKTTFQRKVYETFDWAEIHNLNFSKHLLGIYVKKHLSGGRSSTMKFKFKMFDKKSYFAFTLASEHHKFCLKLRKSFHSLKPLTEELNIPLVNKDKSSDSSIKEVHTLNEKSKSEPSLSQALGDIIEHKAKEKMNRFKHIKISMQNDQRLQKIKNKLFRRSNSFANVENEKCDPAASKPNSKEISKEENQNRENEVPRVTIVDEIKSVKSSQSTLSRNKVKMGTRVFSPHFLSKSVDNILNSSELKLCNSIDINDVGFHNDTCSLNNLNSVNSQSHHSLVMQNKSQHPTVIDSNIPTVNSYYKTLPAFDDIRCRSNIGHFTIENESFSETLLDKFNNMSTCSKSDERIIKNVFVRKDLIESVPKNRSHALLGKLTRYSPFKPSEGSDNSPEKVKEDAYTLGISIIEGKDNNVYVKDLMKNGPGERNGIKIGDQIIAVNGISLVNIPYNESLRILKATEIEVKLTVAQLLSHHIVAAADNVKVSNDLSRITHTTDFGLYRGSKLQPHGTSNIDDDDGGFNDINNLKKQISVSDYQTSQNIISKRILDAPKAYESINRNSKEFKRHALKMLRII